MKWCRVRLVAYLAVVVSVLASAASFGCGGGAAIGGAQTDWPERIEALVGLTTTPGAVTDDVVWRADKKGVVSRQLPRNNKVEAGACGKTVVYSDLDTGLLYVWHPDASGPDQASRLEVPKSGDIASDLMALSPDERTLALVRYESSELSEFFTVHGYLLDLESGKVELWDWLESVRGDEEVTALTWGRDPAAVYVSLGPSGGDRGQRTYRFVLSTGMAAELTGLGAVLDVTRDGKVVGLGNDAAGGTVGGGRSLVLWQGGETTGLPRHRALSSYDFAWISDDGMSIVVWGDTPRAGLPRHCLAVYKLGDLGWEPGWLFTDDSLLILPGIDFEPDSPLFCFQAGRFPGPTEGFPSNMSLYEMETDLEQVYYPPLLLPGAGEGYSRALVVVGAETIEGVCPVCE